MRACDRHGIDKPVKAVETLQFEQSREKYDLCQECFEEIRKALESREIGFVEKVTQRLRGRPRKDQPIQEN